MCLHCNSRQGNHWILVYAGEVEHAEPTGLFQGKPEVQSHARGGSTSLLSPLPSSHPAVVVSLQQEPLLPKDKALLVLPAGNSFVSMQE